MVHWIQITLLGFHAIKVHVIALIVLYYLKTSPINWSWKKLDYSLLINIFMQELWTLMIEWGRKLDYYWSKYAGSLNIFDWFMVEGCILLTDLRWKLQDYWLICTGRLHVLGQCRHSLHQHQSAPWIQVSCAESRKQRHIVDAGDIDIGSWHCAAEGVDVGVDDGIVVENVEIEESEWISVVGQVVDIRV